MEWLTDWRHSLRVVAARPGFSLLVIIPLALGIGANTAIFSAVHAVLLRSLPYEDPDRLVRLWEARPRMGPGAEEMAAFSMDHFRAWRESNEVFEGMAAYGNASFNLTGGAEPIRIEGQRVSPSLFAILGVEALHGRVLSSEERIPGKDRVAVLSHGLWQRTFGGNPSLVGGAIRLDGHPYTVVGVMPPDFRFPDAGSELWVPLPDETAEPSRPGEMRIELVPVIAKLAPGVSIERAEAEGNAFLDHYRETSEMAHRMDEGVSIHLTSLKEQLVRPIRPALLVLFAAVGLVLLIACANVADLLLVRAQSRDREIALRSALGAGGARIAAKLVMEGLVYAIPAGVLGVLIAWWGVRALSLLVPSDLPQLDELSIDGTVLAFNVVIALSTALLVGMVPALRALRLDLVAGLRGLGGTTSTGRSSNLLAAAEVGIALVLLMAAGLMLRSFETLTRVDPGYQARDLLSFRLSLPQTQYPDAVARRSFYDVLRASLEGIPGVTSAGLVNSLPLDRSRMITVLDIEGRPPVADRMQMPRASVRVVSPGFFRAMGIRLLQGRDHEDGDDPSSPSAVVVNQSLAERYFANEEPVGKRLRNLGEIVGVVADVRQEGLDASPEPEMYLSYRDIPDRLLEGVMSVVVRHERRANVTEAVEARVRQLDPDLPLADVRQMEARLSDSVARPRLYATLLTVFAAFALVLAVSGVYAVMSYAWSRRRRESGVRIALGARPQDIVRLVLADALHILLLGLGGGALAAMVLSRSLSSFLFEVTATDPATLLAVSLLLGTAVLGAGAVPAIQSSRTDPVKALRHE
ncbi:MAG TPA: ABC transporter permease [Vicinamibacteria bacterium]|nr:ABC transporter permease [Vicinamibacteria bacterium]